VGYAGGSAARKAGHTLSSEHATRERVEEETDMWGPFVSEIERGKVRIGWVSRSGLSRPAQPCGGRARLAFFIFILYPFKYTGLDVLLPGYQ
jgi:hypothetical protein